MLLAAGQRNRTLANLLFTSGSTWTTPPPHDWAIAVAFYAALYFVDAYLAERGLGRPGDHQTRNALVNSVAALKPLAPFYNQLYGRSRTARYDPTYRFNAAAVRAVFNDMQYLQAEIGKIL